MGAGSTRQQAVEVKSDGLTFRSRLLQDIAELQKRPSSSIQLSIQDNGISVTCLVFASHRWLQRGLSIDFSQNQNGLQVYPPQYRGLEVYVFQS